MYFLLQWIASKHKTVFDSFLSRTGRGPVILSTVESQALKTYVRLTSRQLLNLAGFFRVRYHIKLENDPKEIKALQSCTGSILLPIFGRYEYDNPKHGLEICRYWTLSLSEEAERIVDEHLATMARNGEPLSSFDYQSPIKEDLPGMNVVFGGDHGDTAFRYHMKLQFSSPTVRKQRSQLSYRCFQTQVAFIGCRKDAYNVLKNTVAGPLRAGLRELRESSLMSKHIKSGRGRRR
jgi:hypothetical protein